MNFESRSLSVVICGCILRCLRSDLKALGLTRLGVNITLIVGSCLWFPSKVRDLSLSFSQFSRSRVFFSVHQCQSNMEIRPVTGARRHETPR